MIDSSSFDTTPSDGSMNPKEWPVTSEENVSEKVCIGQMVLSDQLVAQY